MFIIHLLLKFLNLEGWFLFTLVNTGKVKRSGPWKPVLTGGVDLLLQQGLEKVIGTMWHSEWHSAKLHTLTDTQMMKYIFLVSKLKRKLVAGNLVPSYSS